MSGNVKTDDGNQALERLARSCEVEEVAEVRSPGSIAQVLAAKIESLFSYNVYNVTTVVMSDMGTEPIEVGSQMKAFNIAEPFDQQGQLQAGTYVVLSRVGGKNIFYAVP